MILRFGRPDSRNETFWRLNAKSFALLIPAVILGHYIDKLVETIQRKNIGLYMALLIQTLLNIVLIYILHRVMHAYSNEFQLTLPGMFFSAMFFGMQTNFLANLKKALH
jgi:hypothetical protein